MEAERHSQANRDTGFALLRDTNFARLFGARLVSTFGSAMAPIAIAFGVLDLTGSAGPVGIVVASQATAQVLFQLFAGALADRGSRKRMIVLADLLAMTSQVTMAFLFLSGRATVPVLAVLMAVNGIALALLMPALFGLVPQVVDQSRLQPANALLGMAQSAAWALGAATAGVLVATLGAGWAIAIDAGTFAVSGALVVGIRVRAQVRPAASGLWAELRGGWQEFVSHRWLWTIVLQFSLVVAAWEGVIAVAGPTVAKRFLGGPTDWGWIMGALGLGTLAGAVLSLRIYVARPMLVASCCVFSFAVPALLLAGPAPLGWICLGSFGAGICGQIFGVLWNTTVQTRVAPEALSRVSAYDHVGSIALAPLGMAATGLILEEIGPQPTLWMAAVMIVVPTLAVLFVPEVRSLRAERRSAAPGPTDSSRAA